MANNNSSTVMSKVEAMLEALNTENGNGENTMTNFTGKNGITIEEIIHVSGLTVVNGAQSNRAPRNYEEMLAEKAAISPFTALLPRLGDWTLENVPAQGDFVLSKNPRLACNALGISYDDAVVFHGRGNAHLWTALHNVSIAYAIKELYLGTTVIASGNIYDKFVSVAELYPGLEIPAGTLEAWVLARADESRRDILVYKTMTGQVKARYIEEAKVRLSTAKEWHRTGTFKLTGFVKSGLTASANRHNRAQIWAAAKGHVDKPRLLAASTELTVDDYKAIAKGEGYGVKTVDTLKLSEMIQHPWFVVVVALSTGEPVVLNTTDWVVRDLMEKVYAHMTHNIGYGWGVAGKAAKMIVNGEDHMAYLKTFTTDAEVTEEDFAEEAAAS